MSTNPLSQLALPEPSPGAGRTFFEIKRTQILLGFSRSQGFSLVASPPEPLSIAAKHDRLRTCCGKDFSEPPGLQRGRLSGRPGGLVTHHARAPALRGHAADQQVGAGGRARGGDTCAGCPVERIEARDSAEGGRVAMLVRAMKLERGTLVQRRAAGEHFYRAGTGTACCWLHLRSLVPGLHKASRNAEGKRCARRRA